jgi:hypothetical protein
MRAIESPPFLSLAVKLIDKTFALDFFQTAIVHDAFGGEPLDLRVAAGNEIDELLQRFQRDIRGALRECLQGGDVEPSKISASSTRMYFRISS